MHQIKGVHTGRGHTRRLEATDRGSSVRRLKAHVTEDRDHSNVSLRPWGKQDKVGHGLHRAEGFRGGLCNREVPFLLATSLNSGQKRQRLGTGSEQCVRATFLFLDPCKNHPQIHVTTQTVGRTAVIDIK